MIWLNLTLKTLGCAKMCIIVNGNDLSAPMYSILKISNRKHEFNNSGLIIVPKFSGQNPS